MNWSVLIKSKTFWSGVFGCITVIAGIATGEITTFEGALAALMYAMGVFGRNAVANITKSPTKGPSTGVIELDSNTERNPSGIGR